MYVYVRPFLYGTWYDTTTWYGKPIISVPFLELQQCPQYIHCCAAGSGLLLAGPMASSQLHERMHACWRDIFHTEGKSKRQASSSLTSPSWYVRPEVRGTRITLAEKVIPVWYWTRISTRGELCSHPECYYVHKQYKSKAQASLQKAEARFLPWCHLTQRATTNDELRSQVASYKMCVRRLLRNQIWPDLTRNMMIILASIYDANTKRESYSTPKMVPKWLLRHLLVPHCTGTYFCYIFKYFVPKSGVPL